MKGKSEGRVTKGGESEEGGMEGDGTEGSEREAGGGGDERKVADEGETRSPIEDCGIALIQGDGLDIEALCPVDPTKYRNL